MSNIHVDKIIPPIMVEVRRPHLSANKKAGMDMANIKIAERPEARKPAVFPDNPACLNNVGAYYQGH
jgi:hypothetical protein